MSIMGIGRVRRGGVGGSEGGVGWFRVALRY